MKLPLLSFRYQPIQSDTIIMVNIRNSGKQATVAEIEHENKLAHWCHGVATALHKNILPDRMRVCLERVYTAANMTEQEFIDSYLSPSDKEMIDSMTVDRIRDILERYFDLAI